MTLARRLASFLTATAGAILAVAAFLLAWFPFWAAIGDGTGRSVVMHGPGYFWGPPILAAVAILAAGGRAWRQLESRTWARATFAGLVWAIPAWLLAVIPGAFVAGILKKTWPGAGRGPEAWFAGYHHSHIGWSSDGLVLMFVVAGPLALGALVPMAAASLAASRRPPASLPAVVSGVATAATVLVVAAFAAFVVPRRTSAERALTNPFTERRTDSLVTQPGGPALALLGAARRGSVDDIERLLLAGTSPDPSDTSGRTALMLAADGCHVEAVILLLSKRDVRVSRRDVHGLDAFEHALAAGKGIRCDATIRALTHGDVRPRRAVLCARMVEAASAGDNTRTDVLVQAAWRNHMRELVAVAHDSAVRSGQHDTARRIAGYGALPPAGSCEAIDPAPAVAR